MSVQLNESRKLAVRKLKRQNYQREWVKAKRKRLKHLKEEQRYLELLPFRGADKSYYSTDSEWSSATEDECNSSIEIEIHPPKISKPSEEIPGRDSNVPVTSRNEACGHSNSDVQSSLKVELAKWISHNNISHNAGDSLLCLLRKYGQEHLPKTARSLLKSAGLTKIENVSSMLYQHPGPQSELEENMTFENAPPPSGRTVNESATPTSIIGNSSSSTPAREVDTVPERIHFQETLLRELSGLRNDVAGLSSMQNDISRLRNDVAGLRSVPNDISSLRSSVAHLSTVLIDEKKYSEMILTDIIPKPFNTSNEVNTFSSSLRNVKLKKQLIICLSKFKNDIPGRTVRDMLKSVATTSVWGEYCRAGGNPDKIDLSQMDLEDVFYMAFQKAHPYDAKTAFTSAVASYLRHAPSQALAQAQRTQQKKNR